MYTYKTVYFKSVMVMTASNCSIKRALELYIT